MRLSTSLRNTSLLIAGCLAGSLAWGAELVRLDLDGSVAGTAGGRRITAELGPGARYVPSAEGRGVEPGSAHAVGVTLPAGVWKEKGALEMRFRPSRTVRITKVRSRSRLIECPLFRAELQESNTNTSLRISLNRQGRQRHEGEVAWGWLDGRKWYHLLLTWDVRAGRFDAYLNGTIQNNIRNWRRPLTDWRLPAGAAGDLEVGGVVGTGEAAVKLAVDSVRMHDGFMDEAAVGKLVAGRKLDPLAGEGRTVYEGGLDLAPYDLTELYSADFSKKLKMTPEDALFDGAERARTPKGFDWVLEGPGRAWTQGGRLWLESLKPDGGGHVVLWNTRVFPSDFLVEFAVSPQDSNKGLNILFFAAASAAGGGIFDLRLPRRGGTFTNYTKGAINSYHVSYWATSGAGQPRRAVNFRKNAGFYMPACGADWIAGEGPGPHRVRVLKVGGAIRVETRGRLSAAWTDDGRTYGPVRGAGRIGLRQMAHGVKCSYTGFRVWKVAKK